MASVRKLPSGKWQAQVARRGIRRSASFRTKSEARDWGARQEYLIDQGEGAGSKAKLSDIFDRYAREVSPSKRGARWEMIRLEKLARDRIGDRRLCDLGPEDFADWRDRRLREVQPSSVRREMVLMSAVMTRCRKEWRLIDVNPLADVQKPANARPRERRVTDDEIAQLEAVAHGPLSKRVVLAFRFAVATAMRAGEICGLRRQDITGSVAHLPMTKNGEARDVPLSSEALAILDGLSGDPVFGLTPRQLDATFRRLRKLAKIEDLHFHDSRHEATTRLSRRVDVLALARITGHRNVGELLTYFNESAEDLAKRLG